MTRIPKIAMRISSVVFLLVITLILVGLPFFAVYETSFIGKEVHHNHVVEQQLLRETKQLESTSADTSHILAILEKQVATDKTYGTALSPATLEDLETQVSELCAKLHCTSG